jgi:LPXTG-motif cell wall-anchored protein
LFEFITDLTTKVPPDTGTSPLMDIIKLATNPPIIYFIGLALIGGVILLVRKFKR